MRCSIIKHRLAYSARNRQFAKVSNAMLDILQEILQSHPFLISRNFETQSCQLYGVKQLNLFAQIKGIVEQAWDISLLPKVILISFIKPFSSRNLIKKSQEIHS